MTTSEIADEILETRIRRLEMNLKEAELFLRIDLDSIEPQRETIAEYKAQLRKARALRTRRTKAKAKNNARR